MPTNSRTPKTKPLNIRIRADQRSLIEQAAKVSNKSLVNFSREAILREAADILREQSPFQLEAEPWSKFTKGSRKRKSATSIPKNLNLF